MYKQGRRHFARHMTVFYLARQGEPDAANLRIGFTVGKALGGAVQRNRMKRRLREAVRLNYPQSEVAADAVINPKLSLLGAEFAEIAREIATAFHVIEKFCGKAKHQEKWRS